MTRIILRLLFVFICTYQMSACSNKSERQNKLIQKGYTSLDQGQTDRAIKYFEDAIELADSSAAAWNGKGVALYRDQQTYAAIQAFDKAIQLNEDYARAYYNRSNAFYRAKEYYRALDDLSAVQDKYRDSAFYQMAIGLSQVGLERYEEAKKAFMWAASIDTSNAEIFTNIGAVYYYLDENDKAADYVLHAINLNEKEANAWNLLALLKSETDGLESALAAANAALKLEAYNPYFLNNRGYIYTLMGEYDKAYKDLRQSISTDEKNPFVYRNLGYLALKKGELDEAKRQFQEAEKMDEDLALLNIFKAELYLREGKITDACLELKKAMSINPAKAKHLMEQHCQDVIM